MTFGLCGSDAPCFQGHDGPVHDDSWHRLQEAEAEKERLRAAIRDHLAAVGSADAADTHEVLVQIVYGADH